MHSNVQLIKFSIQTTTKFVHNIRIEIWIPRRLLVIILWQVFCRLGLVDFFGIALDRNVPVIFKLGLTFIDYRFWAQHWAHHFAVIWVGVGFGSFGVAPDCVVGDIWFDESIRPLVDYFRALFPISYLFESPHSVAHEDLGCLRLEVLQNFGLEKFFLHDVWLQWHRLKFCKGLSADFERVSKFFCWLDLGLWL